MSYARQYLRETAETIQKLDIAALGKGANLVVDIKRGGGHQFVLGVGNGSGNCSRAVTPHSVGLPGNNRSICSQRSFRGTLLGVALASR